jgi:hypothetical protein
MKKKKFLKKKKKKKKKAQPKMIKNNTGWASLNFFRLI